MTFKALYTKSILATLMVNLLVQSCYYLEAARIQNDISRNKKPIQRWLQSPDITENEKQKLILAQEVIAFSRNYLNIESKGNYEEYSRLNQPYVSHLLSAAEKWDLKPKIWYYPIVGRLPYRGFATEAKALSEAQKLEAQGYETYVRGVPAFSTLGWFKDPILSTFITLDDFDFVETLIHELIHLNIFIKNHADFNEALATYLGVWGAKLFFEHTAPNSSGRMSPDKLAQVDQKIKEKIAFSRFLKKKIEDLREWYKLQNSQKERDENLRTQKLRSVQEECQSQKLKYCHYLSNNAKILAFGTYYEWIEPIDAAVRSSGLSFPELLRKMKALIQKENLSPDKLLSTIQNP